MSPKAYVSPGVLLCRADIEEECGRKAVGVWVLAAGATAE